ncbi:MAG: hypothetical protein KDB53_08785 [Planctomycetes bacterium]|nr:hypothetical protein [Planctomycetota bacterium]
MQKLLILVFVMGAAGLPAQQLETNDAGGALRSGGMDPVPGQPFLRNATGSLDLELSGGSSMPCALVLGALASTSTPVNLLPNEFFDLDLMTSLLLIVDGIGGGGALPTSFGVLNPLGTAAFNFPLNASHIGQSFSFQGVVVDPLAAPLFFNLTAASSYQVSNAQSFTGDDTLMPFVFANGPYSFYGQNFTEMRVSTNGWVQFGGTAQLSDPTETVTEFRNGTLGASAGGPLVAVLWEDLDLGNHPGQFVLMDEPLPGLVKVTWTAADYFPAIPIGTICATFDFRNGVHSVQLDYQQYLAVTPPAEGLVGVSAGGLPGTVATAMNLAQGGIVQTRNPSLSARDTIYQNFDGSGAPAVSLEPFDLGGLVINFVQNSTGGIQVF